jgi:hypothetical protein
MQSDEDRRTLYGLLEQALGTKGAALMMDLLPPAGWSDLARQSDVAMLRADLGGDIAGVRRELAEVRTELKGDIAGLRTEMAGLRTELKGDMAELRTEMAGLRTELKGDIAGLRTEMAGLRTDLKGDIGDVKGEVVVMRGELARIEGRMMYTAFIGGATAAGLVVAAAGTAAGIVALL